MQKRIIFRFAEVQEGNSRAFGLSGTWCEVVAENFTEHKISFHTVKLHPLAVVGVSSTRLVLTHVEVATLEAVPLTVLGLSSSSPRSPVVYGTVFIIDYRSMTNLSSEQLHWNLDKDDRVMCMVLSMWREKRIHKYFILFLYKWIFGLHS